MSVADAMKQFEGSAHAPRSPWRCALFDPVVAAGGGAATCIDPTEFGVRNSEYSELATLIGLGTDFRRRIRDLDMATENAISLLRRHDLIAEECSPISIGGVNTGCGQALFLFVALALRGVVDPSLRRETTAALFWLVVCRGRPRERRNVPHFYGVGNVEGVVSDQYRCLQSPATMKSFLELDAFKNRADVCYLVMLIPTDDDADAPRDQPSWQSLTSDHHGASHEFLVRLVGREIVIVQAFFGYYTIQDWLRFDRPLQVNPAIEVPVLADWRRPLSARPRFRGLLARRKALEFAEALDRIAANAPSANRDYADITGLSFAEPIDCSVNIYRLNLPARAYK